MIEEILAQVIELANRAGLGPIWVLAALLAAAVLLVLGRKVASLPRDPPAPPEPPSEWGDNVVPGPPGGTDDQIQSG